MPVLVVLLLLIASTYQLFFRFDHWNDPNQAGVVYERDQLTGQVHRFTAGTRISLINRLTGEYPDSLQADTTASVKTPPLPTETDPAPSPKNAATVMILGVSTPGPDVQAQRAAEAQGSHVQIQVSEPTPDVVPTVTASKKPLSSLFQKKPPVPPAPSSSSRSNAKPATVSLAAPVVTTPLPQHEHRVDLNLDGAQEKIALTQSRNDGLLDIAIMDGQREVFYGRGQRLQVLGTRQNRWADVALVMPSGDSQSPSLRSGGFSTGHALTATLSFYR